MRPGRLKMGEPINANGTEIWTERRGQGPDVLLIAGLGEPAEAWQPQLDRLSKRYLLTAFDNRGAGRTPLPEGRLSATTMADDAAALLRTLEVPSAHVAGFSMGSAIAQEMALRHPDPAPPPTHRRPPGRSLAPSQGRTRQPVPHARRAPTLPSNAPGRSNPAQKRCLESL